MVEIQSFQFHYFSVMTDLLTIYMTPQSPCPILRSPMPQYNSRMWVFCSWIKWIAEVLLAIPTQLTVLNVWRDHIHSSVDALGRSHVKSWIQPSDIHTFTETLTWINCRWTRIEWSFTVVSENDPFVNISQAKQVITNRMRTGMCSIRNRMRCILQYSMCVSMCELWCVYSCICNLVLCLFLQTTKQNRKKKKQQFIVLFSWYETNQESSILHNRQYIERLVACDWREA